MISKEELINYSKARGIKNLGFAELDYFQNIFLFIIYKRYSNELVFKGGTALYKCYNLDRFSEDLDFNLTKEADLTKIENGLKDFKIEYDKIQKDFERSKKIKFRIKGPLYNGSQNSLCKLELDFSLREAIETKPVLKKLGRLMEEIPSFEVLVMSPEEILAEKFRTVFTRNKGRDVYDIYFLLERGTKPNKDLINKKLKYYSLNYDKKRFIEELKKKKAVWNSEMARLVDHVPKFEEVIKKIKSEI